MNILAQELGRGVKSGKDASPYSEHCASEKETELLHLWTTVAYGCSAAIEP